MHAMLILTTYVFILNSFRFFLFLLCVGVAGVAVAGEGGQGRGPLDSECAAASHGRKFPHLLRYDGVRTCNTCNTCIT